jgi:hypothetical protein
MLPRTNIHLYENISYTHTDEKIPIIGTRNIYIDNINEQISKFKTDWEIMNHVYYPYEFLGDVMQIASPEQDEHCNPFFSLRYAMHLELHHFLKHEILFTNLETKTLVFYGDDKYNLNCMNYLNNKNNKNICIKYNSTKINKLLSKNSSSIDHIIIGSHSVDDNEDDYARISYISVLYALCFQKYNGSSIIKLFNIDTPLSIGILSILSSMYLEVHIVKPVTSKSDTPEIFVVCKNFLHKNSNLFYTKFMNIIQNLTNVGYEYEFLKKGAINLQLMNKINEISIIFYQRRLEYIHTIINTSFIQSPIIKAKSQLLQTQSYESNTKVNAMIKSSIHKCIEWSSKYYKPIVFSTEINTVVLRHLYDIISVINI